MKKLMIIGAVVCSGILFASISMSSSQQEEAPAQATTESRAACVKYTDVCPDGGVGYHCAIGPGIYPPCRLSPTGQCAQIWPCEPVSND